MDSQSTTGANSNLTISGGYYKTFMSTSIVGGGLYLKNIDTLSLSEVVFNDF